MKADNFYIATKSGSAQGSAFWVRKINFKNFTDLFEKFEKFIMAPMGKFKKN